MFNVLVDQNKEFDITALFGVLYGDQQRSEMSFRNKNVDVRHLIKF